MNARLALVAASLLATHCAGSTRGAASVDRADATRSVAAELDDFHDAAARAAEERYFSHFAPRGVFLGPDATERWTVPAFRAYAHARFSTGKGWTYAVLRRAVDFSEDGSVAWFDEDLRGEKAGPCRGSGVLIRDGGRYRLVQYNLAVTVPNERFADVRTLLDGG